MPVTGQATCLVGETSPRTESFAYDGTLQVVTATRPLAGEFNAKGGPWGRREFLYTNGSDRDWATEDCAGWQSTYDASRRLTRVSPRANGCTGTCTTDRSWARKDFTYDADGRMVELKDTPLTLGIGKRVVLTPDDGFGSVYKAVQVNGADYQYLYDAQGRRRLKVYPTGKQDEYFYEGDNLIEDVGETSLVADYGERHMLNQYVWLGGMPVAVVKTTTDKEFNRVENPTQCMRNDEAEPCGTHFIINDYLPKPVAVLDSAGKLAGTGEYDVFGKVNEVAVVADTPAYPASAGSVYPFGSYREEQNTVLAYLKQPAGSASLSVQLRVKYAAINTNVGDVTWVEDGDTGALLTNQFFGQLGQKTTGWLPVGPGGLVHVRWQSDFWPESLPNFTGVTVGSYEYRRFETGASPWWVPLRFPGQYADAETGLFENWNRFYDPSTGRYSASDPYASNPKYTRDTSAASLWSTYGYASQNPLVIVDPTGLKSIILVGGGLVDPRGKPIELTAERKALLEKQLRERYLQATGEKSAGDIEVRFLDSAQPAAGQFTLPEGERYKTAIYLGHGDASEIAPSIDYVRGNAYTASASDVAGWFGGRGPEKMSFEACVTGGTESAFSAELKQLMPFTQIRGTNGVHALRFGSQITNDMSVRGQADFRTQASFASQFSRR
ncbi:MAG: RHS repeat-associated core domain-containing protein [Myxococcota bacterium]